MPASVGSVGHSCKSWSSHAACSRCVPVSMLWLGNVGGALYFAHQCFLASPRCTSPFALGEGRMVPQAIRVPSCPDCFRMAHSLRVTSCCVRLYGGKGGLLSSSAMSLNCASDLARPRYTIPPRSRWFMFSRIARAAPGNGRPRSISTQRTCTLWQRVVIA